MRSRRSARARVIRIDASGSLSMGALQDGRGATPAAVTAGRGSDMSGARARDAAAARQYPRLQYEQAWACLARLARVIVSVGRNVTFSGILPSKYSFTLVAVSFPSSTGS